MSMNLETLQKFIHDATTAIQAIDHYFAMITPEMKQKEEEEATAKAKAISELCDFFDRKKIEEAAEYTEPESEKTERYAEHKFLAETLRADVRTFIESGNIRTIKYDHNLSFFVTSLCVTVAKSRMGDNGMVLLSEDLRNQSCFEIAKDPQLVLRLNAAARLLLLQRLKTGYSSEQLSSLPAPIAKACRTLPHCAESLFWLPTQSISWIPYLGSAEAFLQNHIINLRSHIESRACRWETHGLTPIESEIMALILVVDPRFKSMATSGTLANRDIDPGLRYQMILKPDIRKILFKANPDLYKRVKEYCELTFGLANLIKEKIEKDKKEAELMTTKATSTVVAGTATPSVPGPGGPPLLPQFGSSVTPSLSAIAAPSSSSSNPSSTAAKKAAPL